MQKPVAQTTIAAVTGVALGVALGCFALVWEREAYVSFSFAVVVYGAGALVGLAGMIALAGRSLRIAWSLVVVAVTLFAAYMSFASFFG